MKTISLKRDEAINQWRRNSDSLTNMQKLNEDRKAFNIRTSFSISAVGIGAVVIAPSTITAISSSIMIGAGLTGILRLHFSHQKEAFILQDSINYCKEQELTLLHNTRAKKGDVVSSAFKIREILEKQHKEKNEKYSRTLIKRVFTSGETKTIYGITAGAIAASLIAVYSVFNDNANQNTATGRKEELEETKQLTTDDLVQGDSQSPQLAP